MSSGTIENDALTAKRLTERERAEKLAKLEKQRAIRWEEEQKQALEARSAQIQQLTGLATKQLEDAKTYHVGAVEKGNIAVMTKAAKDKEKQDRFDEHHQRRTEAVTSLKEHSDLARAEVIISADKNVRKQKAALKKLEEDKDSMLAKGLNPYAEFRKIASEEEAENKLRKLHNDIKQSKAHLAVTMTKEEIIRLKEEKKTRQVSLILSTHSLLLAVNISSNTPSTLTQDRDYEQAARDEQARLVIETRVSKYISKVTGGRDLIDPTGRAPPSDVQPSQLVEVPDYTFGQGKSVKIPDSSMKRITERIRSELKVDKEDLGEYKRLITGLLQETGKEGVATLHGRKLKGSETGGVVSFAAADAGGGGGEVIGSLDLKEEELREARNEQERRLAELQGLASVLGSVPGAAGAAADVNMGWGNT